MVFGHYIDLVTDGSIVTTSVTFCKYMRYVIATRRKPYLFIYQVQCSEYKLYKIEIFSLCLRVFSAKWKVKHSFYFAI